MTKLIPNKTLKPTSGGAFSSAFAVHVVGPARLGFLRLVSPHAP